MGVLLYTPSLWMNTSCMLLPHFLLDRDVILQLKDFHPSSSCRPAPVKGLCRSPPVKGSCRPPPVVFPSSWLRHCCPTQWWWRVGACGRVWQEWIPSLWNSLLRHPAPPSFVPLSPAPPSLAPLSLAPLSPAPLFLAPWSPAAHLICCWCLGLKYEQIFIYIFVSTKTGKMITQNQQLK